jgi:hypothetical protein
MAVDLSKFRYRIGDKIRSKHGAEYEIINIQYSSSRWNSDLSIGHYRIKSLVKGCLDQPFWISQRNLLDLYEPCNPAIKLLFDNNRGSEATKTPPSANMANKSGGLGGVGGSGIMEIIAFIGGGGGGSGGSTGN